MPQALSPKTPAQPRNATQGALSRTEIETRLRRFQKLSPSLQDAMFSSNISRVIGEIAEKNSLKGNTATLAALVGEVFLGILHPNLFIRTFSQRTGLPIERARGVAREVSARIFSRVRDELLALYKIEAATKPTPPKPPAPAVPAEVPGTRAPGSKVAGPAPPARLPTAKPLPKATAPTPPSTPAPKPPPSPLPSSKPSPVPDTAREGGRSLDAKPSLPKPQPAPLQKPPLQKDAGKPTQPTIPSHVEPSSPSHPTDSSPKPPDHPLPSRLPGQKTGVQGESSRPPQPPGQTHSSNTVDLRNTD